METFSLLIAYSFPFYAIIIVSMNKFRKLVLSFLSFLILFTSSMTIFSAPKTLAQDTFPWYDQSFPQWYKKVYDRQTSPPQEIFGERYTAAQVQWVIYSLAAFPIRVGGQALTCILGGGSTDSCIAANPYITYNTSPEPYAYQGVFATLFSPDRPLSGVNYARSKLASLHIIPQAEAQSQGFGFSALNPIQNIWRICRDIMYGFFVIIIIIFAFMIMFRVKLNPQTVVSIQSSIPKIVITMILVTFSYAIAGLMIDLTYVVIGIVALIFSSFGFINVGTGTWGKIFELITSGPGLNDGSPGGILGWIMGYWWNFTLAFFGSVITMFGSDLWGGGIVGVVIGIFLVIGVFLWLIVTTVKVFILLIKTYLSVLISIIFSPFLIGFGAILPTGGFGLWLKSLASNLLVYPVSGALILLCVLFLSGTTQGVRTSIENWIEVGPGAVTDIFNPASVGEFWYPPMTLGTQSGDWDPLPILWTFASLGILAMLPNTANMIKSLMAGKGVEGPDLLGKGAALAGGLAMGASFGKGLWERNVLTPIAYTSARRAESGGGRISRVIGSWGARQGYIETPSPTQIRKKGVWYNRQPPNNPPAKP